MFNTWNWLCLITIIIKRFTIILFALADLSAAMDGGTVDSISSQRVHVVSLTCHLFSACLNRLSKHLISSLTLDDMCECPAELLPQAIYHNTVPLISITPQPGRLHGDRVGTGFSTCWTYTVTCLLFVPELSLLAASLAGCFRHLCLASCHRVIVMIFTIFVVVLL